jgi:hypothetical protein
LERLLGEEQHEAGHNHGGKRCACVELVFNAVLWILTVLLIIVFIINSNGLALSRTETCILFFNQGSCERNNSRVGNGGCVWNETAPEPDFRCVNPECKAKENAQSIVLEFLALSYTIACFATVMTAENVLSAQSVENVQRAQSAQSAENVQSV